MMNFWHANCKDSLFVQVRRNSLSETSCGVGSMLLWHSSYSTLAISMYVDVFPALGARYVRGKPQYRLKALGTSVGFSTIRG